MKTDQFGWVLKDVIVALVLLTRLPMPQLAPKAFADSARAVWAYPLAGLAVGVIAGALGMGASALGLPGYFVGGITVACLIVLTGAMHEDGLADTADGFWGGNSVERRLEIMKDSQLGTYGVLALMVTTGLRWGCYAALVPLGLGPVLAAAALSRAVMPVAMRWLPNARTEGLSHSTGIPGTRSVLAGLALALSVALMAVGSAGGFAMIVLFVVSAGCNWLAQRKIGGQTGDVLGATQQLCELGTLCVLVVLLT